MFKNDIFYFILIQKQKLFSMLNVRTLFKVKCKTIFFKMYFPFKIIKYVRLKNNII